MPVDIDINTAMTVLMHSYKSDIADVLSKHNEEMVLNQVILEGNEMLIKSSE